jgi:hypothetical protein
VGVASVDAADLREAEHLRTNNPAEASKVPSREALINVREWRHANVAELSGDLVRVGPVELPLTDAYDVLAWNPEAQVYYYRRYVMSDSLPTTSVDVGTLDPQHFTGVRLTLKGSAEFSSVRAIVGRVPPAETEQSSQFLRLAQVIAPELTEAVLKGEPIALTLDQPNIVAPLPPDEAVEFRFIAPTEQESEPVQVPLVEGKIVDAEISLDDIFPAGATATIDLEGTLEVGDTGRPLPGATVLREIGGRTETFTTDDAGKFRVAALPMDRVTAFDLQTTRGGLKRPVVPERWSFEFVPPLATTGSLVRMRWQVPAYRYIVLDLSSPGARDAVALASTPYPVYILEREKEGRWQLEPIDFFDVGPQELAVAITEPGTYRVLLAASPIAVWESEPVLVTASTVEAGARLAQESSAHEKVTLRVVDASNGNGVAKAIVLFSGPHSSLPPLRWLTNDRGELELSHHGVDTISVWIEKKGYLPSQRTLSSGELRGEVEIQLAPETAREP